MLSRFMKFVALGFKTSSLSTTFFPTRINESDSRQCTLETISLFERYERDDIQSRKEKWYIKIRNTFCLFVCLQKSYSIVYKLTLCDNTTALIDEFFTPPGTQMYMKKLDMNLVPRIIVETIWDKCILFESEIEQDKGSIRALNLKFDSWGPTYLWHSTPSKATQKFSTQEGHKGIFGIGIKWSFWVHEFAVSCAQWKRCKGEKGRSRN